MNRETVSFHLREALEAMNAALTEFAADAEYDKEELRIALQHVYHHLNTAWNAQGQALADISDEASFHELRRMPGDLDL